MSKSPTDKIGVEDSSARTGTDDRYRALASEDRRLVLDVLSGTTSLTLEGLVDEVMAKKRDGSTRTQVKISLVHQHLPVLEDAGVVDHDREDGRITHSERALEELLDLL